MRKLMMLPAIAAVLALSACSGGQKKNDYDSDPLDAPIAGEEFVTDDMARIRNVPLITRDQMLRQPQISRLRMSPDGSRISFLKPHNGMMNIWVGTTFEDAQPITSYDDKDLGGYNWAYNNQHILYGRDDEGKEEIRLYMIDALNGGEPQLVTDFPANNGIRAGIAATSRDHPNTVIISMNNTPQFGYQVSNLYKLDLTTGKLSMHWQNPGMTSTGFCLGAGVNDDFEPITLTTVADSGYVIQIKTPRMDSFEKYFELPFSEVYTTSLHGFNDDMTVAYVSHAFDTDKAALYKMDVDTQETELIYVDDKADIAGVWMDPLTDELLAAAVNYKKVKYKFFDRPAFDEFQRLEKLSPGDEVSIVSRTADDRRWLVAFVSDKGSVDYYRWDRGAQTGKYVTSIRPDLKELPMVDMHALEIPTEDGLTMVCYLSLPATATRVDGWRLDRSVPLVLDVHGGPHARDSWGFNGNHQLLANRGYAVLSVNYRGSTGFGKEFVARSMKQWGRAMHKDLLDAVQWCIDQGIADPERVAITGGSYGGYATLWGMTNTPDWFTCGVSVVGPSNLVTLLENAPNSWRPIMPMMYERMGDPNTEEGLALLKERSPLYYVENINKPLLIGQGANDPRVTQVESEQIVAAMKQAGIPVSYVLYPDEGHGWSKRPNRYSWTAVQEAFLAKHLGGRYEPISNALEGSSITVPEGAAGVPGLAKALGLDDEFSVEEVPSDESDDESSEQPESQPDEQPMEEAK